MKSKDFDTLDNTPTRSGGKNEFNTLDGLPTIQSEDGKESKLIANRYKAIRKLGEGGMGTVYLAEDTEFENSKVAIKFIPPILAGNVRAIKNLKKEAQTARNLSHPNIVKLHDLHTDGHQKFLVMEYIDGKTLEEMLAEKENDKLTLEELLPIAECVAAGLDYAHSKKILHRDLKPSNIIIGKSGIIKILDFGIAREIKDCFTRVTGEEPSGTLPYMSPQQLTGKKLTPSMDIYSLGAVLYECLSGHPPFHRGDIREQIQNNIPKPIENVPQNVNKTLLASLAKDISARPSTATELIKGFTAKSFEPDTKTSKTKAVKPPQKPAKEEFTKPSVDDVFVKEIEDQVIEIISEQMGADKSDITRETSFINDLNADSLDTVELVMEFEDEFDMSIPDEEAEKIQTVGAAIDYIVNFQRAKSQK
jgi:serine/threonine-protein kinase